MAWNSKYSICDETERDVSLEWCSLEKITEQLVDTNYISIVLLPALPWEFQATERIQDKRHKAEWFLWLIQTCFVILRKSNFFQNFAFTAGPVSLLHSLQKVQKYAEWECYQRYMANVYCYCTQYFSQIALNSLSSQFKVLWKTRKNEDELFNSWREGWCRQKGKLLKIHNLEISFSTEHICA